MSYDRGLLIKETCALQFLKEKAKIRNLFKGEELWFVVGRGLVTIGQLVASGVRIPVKFFPTTTHKQKRT